MNSCARVIGVSLALALASAAMGQVFSSTTVPVAVNDTPTVDDSITVSGGPTSITDLNVVIYITHTFDGDLDFVLIPPGDAEYIHLSSDNGGTGENFLYTRFDQAAATSITTGVVPYRGTLLPEGGVLTPWIGTIALPATALADLSAVNGRDSNGVWTLRIDDDAGADQGFLQAWYLEFNGAQGSIPLAVAATGITPAAPYLNGDSMVFAVTVAPAEVPASTGIVVVGDLSPVGGSATAAFHDDGLDGDAAAADNIFSFRHVVTGAALGATNCSVTVTDTQGGNSPGNFAFTIANGGQGAPTATVDLGSLANPATSTGTLTGLVGGEVRWLRLTIPEVSSATSTFLDIDTNGAGAGNTFTNSSMALFNASGNRMGNADLDDGPSLFSMLSYGMTTPIRPAVPFAAPATANGLTHAGVDGATLAPGTYWLGIGATGTTFLTTNWRYTTTSTQAGDCAYRIELGSNTSPTPPSGVAAASPSPAASGQAVLLTVVVTPGTNPVSSGVVVRMDLSTIGGSATEQLFDDGTHGDASAGDNTFTLSYTIPTSVAEAAYTLAFTITDAQSRSGSGPNLALNVFVPAQWDETTHGLGDAGDISSSAQTVAGSGSLASIGGSILSSSDVDLFKITICEPSNFSATTENPTTGGDTQLWLFTTDGVGISHNDDAAGTAFALRSRLSNVNTSSLAAGEYLLGISRYNRDAVDSGGQLLWAACAGGGFTCETGPTGPGAANPVAGWINTSGTTGVYKIQLTGACYAGAISTCAADVDDGSGTGVDDGAVTIDDLIYYLGAYEAGTAAADVDNGTFTGTLDQAVTVDDLLYYLFRFDAGC